MNADDRALIDAFESLTLGLEHWTQRTHVAIAFLYLTEHGHAGALDRLRGRIKAFNLHHGIEETPTSGYNETTTAALLTLVDSVRRAYAEHLPAPDAESFCDAHPELMSKHVLRFFYSPGRRLHPDAKERFVEPDLAPLPAPPGRRLILPGSTTTSAREMPPFVEAEQAAPGTGEAAG